MRPLHGVRIRQFCRCYSYVKCVEDTTSDNASPTQPKALVGYIDDDAWLKVRRDAVRHGLTIARWIGLTLETWARRGDVEES